VASSLNDDLIWAHNLLQVSCRFGLKSKSTLLLIKSDVCVDGLCSVLIITPMINTRCL